MDVYLAVISYRSLALPISARHDTKTRFTWKTLWKESPDVRASRRQVEVLIRLPVRSRQQGPCLRRWFGANSSPSNGPIMTLRWVNPLKSFFADVGNQRGVLPYFPFARPRRIPSDVDNDRGEPCSFSLLFPYFRPVPSFRNNKFTEESEPRRILKTFLLYFVQLAICE